MAYLNDHYLKLKAGYLFPEIARRVNRFCEANPAAAKRLIRCGIGDVTEPLPTAVTAAMHKAVDDMATREGFHGYGPEQGYEWLRLVSYGLTVHSSTYGATFYTLVGAHAAHVLGALVWLTICAALLARGRFTGGRTGAVRACALYWHFVVALWPVLYVTVYLL